MRIASAFAFVAVVLVACGGKLAPEDPPSADEVDAVNEVPRVEAAPPLTMTPPDEATPAPPPRNDLTDPEAAKTCAERAAMTRGKVEETWSDAPDRVTDAASVSVAIGSERLVDGKYETSISFSFDGTPSIVRDPVRGLTREESFWTVGMVLVSAVPRPDAFAIGKPEVVGMIGGSGGSQRCSEDGTFEGGSSAYGNDPTEVIVTLTERSDTMIAGFYEEKGPKASHRLSFVSPIAKPSNSGAAFVCCLKQ